MVYVPNFSNEQAVAQMVIGADVNDTVTPANPTPPTNIPAAGFTPPSTKAIAAPADPDDWGDPKPFADSSGDSAIGGMEPEGAGYEGYDSTIDANHVDLLEYNFDPNIAHPSHPDYAGSTVLGRGEHAVGGDDGDDAVYADEDFEEEEEEAAKAAREARGEAKPAPKNGRRKKAKAKGRHK